PRIRRLRLVQALVLILFLVQFQVEQALQIARGSAATAASAATLTPERHLNIAERRFGTKQILQRLLLRRQRVLPLRALQLIRRGLHFGDSLFHIVHETLERISGLFELPRFHAVRKALRLILELALHARKERRVLLLTAARALAFCLIPGRGDDFLLALRDLVLLAAIVTPAAATAAALLALREVALERVGLNEEHVGVRGLPRILRDRVQAHDITRFYFEVFERNDCAAARSLRVFCAQQRNHLFRRPVYAVMQL